MFSFTERDMEEVVAKHPDLIEDGLTLLDRQVFIGLLRVDLLFRDKFGDTLVVELKRGTIKREHVGQIMEYSGTLYNNKPVRLMLIGNRVPPSFKKSLEYHGIEWKEISEEQIIQYLRKKEGRPPLEPRENIAKVFQRFRNIRDFVAGEGIIEESVDSWYRARKEAKEKYARLFSLENLRNLTAEDFESFLYFRNNRSWTTLYRRGCEAAENMHDLKKALSFLQNESVDIRTRINSVLYGGSYHIKGLGKNIATAILHICDKKDKYGVWNNRTEGGLKKLERLPRRTYNNGEFYCRINIELNRFKKELKTDLIMIDSFLWYVDKTPL